MPDEIPVDTIHLAPDNERDNRIGTTAGNPAPGGRRSRFAFGSDESAVSLSNAGLALIGLHRRPRGAGIA